MERYCNTRARVLDILHDKRTKRVLILSFALYLICFFMMHLLTILLRAINFVIYPSIGVCLFLLLLDAIRVFFTKDVHEYSEKEEHKEVILPEQMEGIEIEALCSLKNEKTKLE
ncbi:hypothetical protein NEFER03_1739 [Nematocida sp. LUAm3]|nr:hypothetical protein NEFER03_1739 [Nematocida sp. LUAm3]KAI5175729.1 hypothetical protein NEFER02_1616 [Nematocida sp. LUAm2]KAI5178635.1 hypothetical protein NEFER01_1771 [Nematocida sp. LUAm1]